MRELVGHLLALGHTSFGLLGISGNARSIRDRIAGIEAALADKGLRFAEATKSLDHLHVRDNDFEYGRALAPQLRSGKAKLSDRLPRDQRRDRDRRHATDSRPVGLQGARGGLGRGVQQPGDLPHADAHG